MAAKQLDCCYVPALLLSFGSDGTSAEWLFAVVEWLKPIETRDPQERVETTEESRF